MIQIGCVVEIAVDPLSPVPLHQQIRDRIVEALGRGKLRRGDALLSVRQLAGALAINPATVVKAYNQLRREGLIATNQKSGSFIAADRDTATPTLDYREQFESRLCTLLAEGRAHGLSDAAILDACARILDSLED